MSIFNSDLQNNPRNNFAINLTTPPLHHSQIQNIILNQYDENNSINNNFNDNNNNHNNNNFNNNYNNYFSTSLINEPEKNHINIIQNLQKKEKQNEIELNIIIKKSESKSTKEFLKISINQYIDKQSRIIIQMTNPDDTLFLYTLELSELEYHQFKAEQSLLVDFQNFPDFVIKMLSFCKNDKDDRYSCTFNISNEGGNNFNLTAPGVLTIEERTEYRKLNLLVLKFQAANDSNLKKYISKICKNYKNKYESLLKKYDELNQNFESYQKENNKLKENCQILELKLNTSMDKLANEKNKEINNIKENNLKEAKNKIDILENEKNKTINELKNKINELQNSLDDMTKNKNKLEEIKFKLEMDKKDIESKYIKSNTELNVYKSEITTLRKENSELNQKCLIDEKQITEFNYKVESLEKQLEEKNKSIENQKQLTDSLQKQKDSYEDIIKSLKSKNNKLEKKMQLSIAEINKGNNIIKQLQDEIINQKSKINSIKNELNSKDQEIIQKQELKDEQNKTIEKIKKEKEDKDKEINELKKELENCTQKLDGYKKLIEEDKQMILYLNKNINENINNPLRARINFSTMNYNNKFAQSSTFDHNTNDENNIINSYNQFSSYNNINNSKNDNSNLRLSNNDNLNNNIFNQTNSKEEVSINQSHSPFMQINNTLNKDDFILPQTNFTGYQFREIPKFPNTYRNNNVERDSDRPGSLLVHKYGNKTYSKSFRNNK